MTDFDSMFPSKWLTFRHMGASASGLTQWWYVFSKTDRSTLGTVSWSGPWRQYVLKIEGDSIWNSECLNDVMTFIANETAVHRQAKAQKRANK